MGLIYSFDRVMIRVILEFLDSTYRKESYHTIHYQVNEVSDKCGLVDSIYIIMIRVI